MQGYLRKKRGPPLKSILKWRHEYVPYKKTTYSVNGLLERKKERDRVVVAFGITNKGIL